MQFHERAVVVVVIDVIDVDDANNNDVVRLVDADARSPRKPLARRWFFDGICFDLFTHSLRLFCTIQAFSQLAAAVYGRLSIETQYYLA
jgi:hypothetical protein